MTPCEARRLRVEFVSFLPLKLHVSTVLESAPNPHLRTRVLVADAVAMSCQLLVDALLLSKRYDAVAAMTPEEVVLSLDRDRFHVMLIGTSFSKDPVEGLRFVSEVRGAELAGEHVGKILHHFALLLLHDAERVFGAYGLNVC